MGKRTRPLTKEEYHEILDIMDKGSIYFRPNKQVRFALLLEANLGMRIEDILELTPDSFLRLEDRYILNYFIERKTGKCRYFTVKEEIMEMVFQYCEERNVEKGEKLFSIGKREVQKYLKKVADYLDLEGIGTHSFRKLFATTLYTENDYDIVLVQTILQHSSPQVTLSYIGMSDQKIEKAILKHLLI